MRIQRPEGRIVRFGLRRFPNGATSVWRMWVQGDETYLAVRTLIGLAKVGLHSSGHWVITVGRHTVAMKGPRPVDENWKVGPRVVFPGVPPTLPFPPVPESIAKRVFLFDPPPHEYWRDFAILFSTPLAKENDLRKILPAGSDVVGPMLHRRGDGAWLATFTTPMTTEEVEYIRKERAKFRVHMKKNPTFERGADALLIWDTIDGDTLLSQIHLGRENIVLAK